MECFIICQNHTTFITVSLLYVLYVLYLPPLLALKGIVSDLDLDHEHLLFFKYINSSCDDHFFSFQLNKSFAAIVDEKLKTFKTLLLNYFELTLPQSTRLRDLIVSAQT